jgi:hypothetical protein
MFFNLAAPAGVNLYGCASANTWSQQGGSGGSGSGGGGAISGVLKAQESSSTVVAVGSSCSISTPCLVQVGSTVYSYSIPASVTLSSGTGSVYLYVDSNGNITAGESGAGSPSISCSGCVAASGVTQFPPDTVPIGVWVASSGSWAAGTNEAAVQSGGPALSAGSNVTLTQTGSSVLISAALQSLLTGTQPGCTTSTGGFMWYTQGSSGVKDTVQVCAKDASDSYAWRTLF